MCVYIYILISGRVFHQPLQCRVVHWLGLFLVAGKFPTYQNPHLGEVYSLLWNLDRIGTVLVRISVEGLAFCGDVLSWGRFSNASTADQQPNLLQRHTSLSKARPENSKETKTKTLNQETEIWRDPEISGFWNNDPIYPSRIIFYLTKTMFFIAQVQAPVEIGSKQLKWYHVIWYLVPGIFFENWTKLLMIWKILPSSLAATHGTYSWHLLQNHKSCLHQEQEKILSYFLLTTLIWMLWLWLDCV